MSIRLATYLLQERILRSDQLDDLLQLQVVEGGSLDTHILEQGLLGEAPLIAAMAAAYALPAIAKQDIEDIAPRIPEIFPRVFAETYRFVPYRLLERNLGVVVSEPPEPAVVSKLEQRLRIHIAPAVTTEARVFYAMHRLYGADIPPRLSDLLAKLDGEAQPLVAPEEAPPLPPELPAPEPMDLDTAQRRMQLARDRDQLIDVVLSYAAQSFQFAGLFVVHDDHVMGYRGRGDATAASRITRVFVPLGQDSMWKTVLDTRGHYLGQVPKAELNHSVLADLGRAVPKTVMLAPFVIRDQVRGLVYADNGKRSVPSRKVADILLLMTRLGVHFERLIQRRKAEVKVAMGRLSEVAVRAADASEPTPAPEPVAPTTVMPEIAEPSAQMKALLAQRMLNVMRAASADDDEDEDKSGEEEIHLEGISADALLGKEAPREPQAPPPPPQEPHYKMFAEVKDEGSTADWQSSLNETIAQGKQGGTAQADAATAPANVEWEDVVVEARAEVAPLDSSFLNDSSVLLDALDSADEKVAGRAAEQLWSRRDDLPELLEPRFPGRVAFDPFAPGTVLPSVPEMSQVLRLLVALGADGVPAVAPHLESAYPVHRLLATLYFSQVVSGKIFPKLLRRLFDDEPRVREAAADVLRGYRTLPGYEEGIAKIRERLQASEGQARAIEIVGRLRDVKAVPLLIPLVAHKLPTIANSALGALMRLTAQDFGHTPKLWTEWWVGRSGEPRERWLIEGLRRTEQILRVIADEELRRLSGLTFRFDSRAARKEQEASIRGWESWWASEERYRRRSAR
jgi:hypothetical protein